jgi:hypothetical protein
LKILPTLPLKTLIVRHMYLFFHCSINRMIRYADLLQTPSAWAKKRWVKQNEAAHENAQRHRTTFVTV